MGDGAEIGLSWQVLARRSVGIFVTATLPGTVWIGKIEIALQAGGNEAMIGELLAVVGGEGVHRVAQAAQPLYRSDRSRRLDDMGNSIGGEVVRSGRLEHFTTVGVAIQS